MLLACAYYPNLGHVCARTDWYVRVVGQPQSLRNPPGRWRRSPGTTRRCSRSRCRRSSGAMPVSFEAARLVDASPTERMDIRATPSGTGPAAVAGSRRRGRRSTESGAGLRSQQRYAPAAPLALALDRSGTPHTARSGDRDAHGGRAGPRRAGERLYRAGAAACRHGEHYARELASEPRARAPPTLHQTPLAAACSHWPSRPTRSSP